MVERLLELKLKLDELLARALQVRGGMYRGGGGHAGLDGHHTPVWRADLPPYHKHTPVPITQRNEAFANSLKEAFESFINQRQNKPAELIAKYLDGRMRAGGGKGQSEDELETVLDRVLVLFRYIQV